MTIPLSPTRDTSGQDADLATSGLCRARVLVRGVVQGVGFRPFVATLARESALVGHCGNDESGVFIEVEGPAGRIDEFCQRMLDEAPPLASIVDVHRQSISVCGDVDFEIRASRPAAGQRTLVAPDAASCHDCLGELADPANRRHRHPFITCTHCGPRFTIINDLPYDRPATTMARFTMCEPCATEYTDPSDRRYHAQPISCHNCGPHMWLEDPGAGADGAKITGDDDVLATLQQALVDGRIVTIKGVGGFHLACDAANEAAVARLRERKHRPDKPFALMVADEETASRIAVISEAELALLTQRSRPIVLLAKADAASVADGVAPGLGEIGIMLPYAPLHHLIFTRVPGRSTSVPSALVMTSGNLTDEPLCFDNQQARTRLAGIADLFCMHDRDIAVPCEDSVVAVASGGELPVRRSRGYAPLPIPLGSGGRTTLGVGAEIKNTFCVTRGDLAFCSAHIGDMGSIESQQAFARSVDQLLALHDVQPELIVADDHPGYSSRSWAEAFSRARGLDFVSVQHHHAHLASLLAEHGRIGTPVIGVVFDGTGYGCDRTIWGGELLTVSDDIATCERLGHLEPFDLPGAEAAVRNPFRIALSLARAAGIDDLGGLDLERAVAESERALVTSLLETGTVCVSTTSVGRLFDGVASLLGLRHRVTYEAQAAIELEAFARTAVAEVKLPMGTEGGVLMLGPLIGSIIKGLRRGDEPAGLAMGFHRALARSTACAVGAMAKERGISLVGLTGGVFQNRLLLEQLTAELDHFGLEVITHHCVPPNDGGLALGQAVIGRAMSPDRPTNPKNYKNSH